MLGKLLGRKGPPVTPSTPLPLFRAQTSLHCPQPLTAALAPGPMPLPRAGGLGDPAASLAARPGWQETMGLGVPDQVPA